MFDTKIRYFFTMKSTFLSWIIPFIVFIVSLIFIYSMSNLQQQANISDPIIIFKYLLYIGVPVTIVSLSKFKQLEGFFENEFTDVTIFLFLLFWIWWGIEFTDNLNLFPNLVKDFGYLLNLLAITTLAWSFFVIKDYFLDYLQFQILKLF